MQVQVLQVRTATGGFRNIVKEAKVVMKGEMVKNLCRLVDTVPSGAVFKVRGEGNALFEVELNRMMEDGVNFQVII